MARLAQSVERKALNLVVVGSSPTVGVSLNVAAVACVPSSEVRQIVHPCGPLLGGHVHAH